MKTLILGYGNPGRSDDGAAWFVVEQLEALRLPGTDLDTRQQLEVELAELLSAYDLVVFVDAATPDAPDAVGRKLIIPRGGRHALSHYLSPADLLALCDSLYGRMPRALLFSVRGRNFEFGNQLSAETEWAALEVVRQIAALVRPATDSPSDVPRAEVKSDHCSL